MLCEQMLIHQETNCFEKGQPRQSTTSHEAMLIKAAQRGDLAAFNQLVLDHQDALFGWVMSHVQDEQTAEDIAQQVFITAYQKINDLRDGSFRAWIFRIARNRSIDDIRYHRRHPSLRLDSDPQDEDGVDLHSRMAADAPLPEDTVIQAEQAAWLRQLLRRLPALYRQALLLVDVHELDYQDAAAVLNLPLGTLKSRISRARVRLRELIDTDSHARYEGR